MESPPNNRYRIRIASWDKDNHALCQIRREVFIQEQSVPEELEWDGEDAAALHLLAESAAGEPIGTARLLMDGHIGRVAVLSPWRGDGVGSALMHCMLVEVRKRNLTVAFLDAQLEAIPFYSRLGFIAQGDTFMDAGIPHRHMYCRLDAAPDSR